MRPRFLQFPRPGQQLRLLRPFLRGQRLRVWRPSWIGQRLSFGDPPGTGNGSGSRGPFDPILKPECPVSASSSRCVSLSTKGYSEFGPGSGSGYGDPPGSVRGVRSGDPSGTRSGHGSCGPSDPSSGFSRIPSNSDTTWMETAHKPDYNTYGRDDYDVPGPRLRGFAVGGRSSSWQEEVPPLRAVSASTSRHKR